jgi:hypothetical protein
VSVRGDIRNSAEQSSGDAGRTAGERARRGRTPRGVRERARDAIDARGDDSLRSWTDRCVFLLHRRLARSCALDARGVSKEPRR